MRRPRPNVLLLASALAGSCASTAQSAPPASASAAQPPSSNTRAEVEDASSRVADVLRERLARLGGDLARRDAALDAEALVERRRREMRDLVRAVLEDADARAAAQTGGLRAGHDGKAFVESADGGHRIEFWGFTQVRFTANRRASGPGVDGFRSGFSIQRTRFYLDGRMDGWIEGLRFRIRTSFSDTGDAQLEQAYVRAPLGDTGFEVRVGQFLLPLFRDDWIAAQNQLAVNQSVVNGVFGQGQAQGVWIERTWDRVRLFASINDGGRSGNTDALGGDGADFAATARFEWRFGAGPWSRFLDYTSFAGDAFGGYLGVAGHYETGSDRPGVFGDRVEYLTVDAGLEGDGWNASALGVVAHDDFDLAAGEATTDLGFLVQGGVFVAEDLECFGRFDWVEGGSERDDDAAFRSVTVGLNRYLSPRSHRLKLSGNLIWFLDPTEGSIVGSSAARGLLKSGRGDQVALQVQLQVVF